MKSIVDISIYVTIYSIYNCMKKLQNPLFLSILATTLVSGVAIVWAWTGPTGNPLLNNVPAPINAGSTGQSKSGSFTSAGLGSTGTNILTGSTMLGGASAPREVLEINGNITQTAARNANANLAGYSLGVDTVGVNTSVYSYGRICANNSSGTCNSTGGVVLGGAVNTGAIVNITESTSFFNGGNVGVGTTTPAARLGVQGDVVAAGTIRSSAGGFRFPDGTTQTTAAAASPWTISGNNIFNSNTGSVGIGGNPDVNARFQISESGQVLQFLTNRAVTGSWPPVAQANTMTIHSSGASAGNLALATGNSEVMRITSGGNVGIGITAPAARLDVSGNTLLRGTAGDTWFSSGAANYIRGNTFFNGMLYDEGNSAFYVNPDSTSIFNDLRSNIWYDNNNTSFYIDGNSTSVLNQVNMNLPLWGDGLSRSETRDNAGLRGDAGARSGFYQTASPVNYYAGASGWQHLIDVRHSNAANNFALQIAGSFFDQNLYFRKTNDNPSQAWSQIIAANPSGNVTVPGTIRSNSGGFIFPDGTTQTTAFTGGAGFIQNQNAAAQSANAWISGSFQSNSVTTSALTVNGQANFSSAIGVTHLGFAGTANYLRGNTFFNGILYDENNGAFFVDPASTSAFNDLRADVFYDRNNTAYYLDPAGISNFRRVVTGNGYQTASDLDVGDPAVNYAPTSSGWNASFRANITLTGADDTSIAFHDSATRVDRIRVGGGQFNIGENIGWGVANTRMYGSTIVDGRFAASTGGSLLQPMIAANGSGLIGGANQAYDIGAGSIAAGDSIYSYDKICAGNSAGNCEGTGGMVMSTANLRFPDGSVQSTAATALTDAVRTNVAGDWNVAANSASSGFSNAGLEVREANFAGAGTGAAGQEPRISFHWGGRVASQIGMDAGGQIRTYNNPGTGFENFAAANITGNGNINATGWVGTTGGSFLSNGGTNYLRGNTFFNGILFDETNSAFYVNPDGTSIYNDLRANILYDNNNTGYYVDPNNVSIMQDVRSSIFYDRDNTGFYLDMNSGSNLSTVTMGTAYSNNWFRSYGVTGWFNETYVGGWFMQDSTWIRSYIKAVYMDAGFDTANASGVRCGGGMGGGYDFRVCGTAGIQAAAFIYSSDERLKENIEPLHNSLDKIRELKGYTFNWKEGGKADVGIIAQEVETIFPQLVTTGDNGMKSVAYGNLVAPLIEAVKELAQMFDALAERVFNTEVRQTELEKQNALQAEQIRELQRQIKELQTAR
jgi:hypothetical protein